MKTKEEILGNYTETEFLARCQLDFKFFCKRLLDNNVQGFHKEWFDKVQNNRRVAILAPTGFGKCFGRGTEVIMYDGTTKKVEDIEPGDVVMGDDSTPRAVANTTKGREKMYKVKQNNGEDYVVNKSHILSLRMNANSGEYKKGEIADINIEDYLDKCKTFKHCAKGFKAPIEFENKEVSLEPYFLGVWLGDGSRGSQRINNSDEEIRVYVKRVADRNNLSLTIYEEESCDVLNIRGRKGKKNYILEQLRKYNLIKNKHIPYEYKTNSEEKRLELLAGLVDTDGYIRKNCINITQKRKKLAEDIVYVARSLGFGVSINKIKKQIKSRDFEGEYYRIGIFGDISRIPCKVERRKEQINRKRKINKNPLNTGIMIEDIGKGEYYGFEIRGDKKRFLLKDFTVTHNTEILGISYPLWLTFTKRKKEMLIVSKSLNQSTRILEHIRNYIEDTPILNELKPEDVNKKWSKTELVTSTNCKIMCRPYSINIKGEHVDYILMDESASYEDPEIYFDYIVPRAASRGGTICLISTPESTTDLMGLIESKGLDYVFGKYPAIYKGESIWPSRFPIEKLEKFRRELGEQYFQKNYMCNPRAESEKSIYKLQDLQAGFDYTRGFTSKDEGGFTFISCDFAISDHSTADFDAYIVLEKVDDQIIIKHIEKHRGVRTPIKTKNIKRLVDEYEPIRVVIDKENIGATMVDSLRAEGISVIPQDFHSQSRTHMLMTMKNIIDSQSLVIPRKERDNYAIDMTNELIEQLINIVETTNPQSGRKQYVSNTAHNDLAMSLTMGLFHANKLKSTKTRGIMGSLRE